MPATVPGEARGPRFGADLGARVAVAAALVAVSAFPLALLVVRIRSGPDSGAVSIVWNLLLAWVPLVLSVVLEAGWRRRWPLPATAAVAAAWLLFFPNAPYLVTEVVQLAPREGVPLWLDALILFSLGVAGLLVGFASLELVRTLVTVVAGRLAGWALTLVVLAATGFGIYLGRFSRYNSWDVLSRPRRILYDVRSAAAEPLSNSRAVAVSAVFTAFVTVSYLAVVAIGRLVVPRRRAGASGPSSER